MNKEHGMLMLGEDAWAGWCHAKLIKEPKPKIINGEKVIDFKIEVTKIDEAITTLPKTGHFYEELHFRYYGHKYKLENAEVILKSDELYHTVYILRADKAWYWNLNAQPLHSKNSFTELREKLLAEK